MRILFCTAKDTDYLSDSLLHGLRRLFGPNVVDYPKAERLYNSYPTTALRRLRGHGFTLYGLLDDIAIERPSQLIASEIDSAYDLVIIGDIWREWEPFVALRKVLTKRNTIILDGADVAAPYRYAGFWWRRPTLWGLPGIGSLPYFKRELSTETLHYRLYKLVPRTLCARFPFRYSWKQISFSIPEEKLSAALPAKTKLIARHIVDPEVATRFEGVNGQYAFENEEEYYRDLQVSRFAITTKRAGWDCLRHYEIAANGCVPCFRALSDKPSSCAPHGLNQANCISYTDVNKLMEKIENIKTDEYKRLQQGALHWAAANTTTARAREVLKQVGLEA